MANLINDEATFQRNFQIAPIILVNGIAANLPNGVMTILSLTEGSEVVYSDVNQYFAQFKPMPGSTLEEWQIAEYPFASLNMAANAMIQMPLRISMLMLCPARDLYQNYVSKQSTITNMKSRLDQHILAGGTFTVATPSFTYSGCLLTALRDVSSSEGKQVQSAYQWDFVQPLITANQNANPTQNGLYNQFTNGLPTSSVLSNSGVSNNIGAPT